MEQTLTDLIDIIDSTSMSMVSLVYGYLAITFMSFVRNLIILSFTLFGIFMMLGYVQYPASAFFKKLFLTITVYLLFFNWPIFEFYIYNFFTNAFDDLGGKLVNIATLSLFSDASVVNSISEIFATGVEAATRATEADGWVMPYISAGIIFLSVSVCCIFSVALICISKIGIAVLLAIAPIFFLFSLFSLTHGMTSAWLKQVFNFGFISLFTYLVLVFFVTTLAISVNRLSTHDTFSYTNMSSLIVVCFVTFIVLLQVPQVASGLASGAQLTTVGAIGAARETAAKYSGSAARGAGGLASKGYNKFKNRSSSNTIKRD